MSKRRCRAIKDALRRALGDDPTVAQFRRAKKLYVRGVSPLEAVRVPARVQRKRAQGVLRSRKQRTMEDRAKAAGFA